VVGTGTPEEIARMEGSYTGRLLEDYLNMSSEAEKRF
jgi:hypothetical protein